MTGVRLLIIAVLTLALVGPTGPAFYAQSAGLGTTWAAPADPVTTRAAPPTYWGVPISFAAEGTFYETQREFRRPFRRFDAQVGAGSIFKLRRFRWSGWGGAKVVGRGRVSFCNYQGCEPFHRGRITLLRRRAHRAATTPESPSTVTAVTDWPASGTALP